MRWTRRLRLTSAAEADGEVVWFWRRDAGVKFAGSKRFLRATVARKPVHRGERDISRKPLRREGRNASAEPVCSCAFSSVHLHARPRVQRASGFPCALVLLWNRANVTQSSGVTSRENEDSHLAVI